jgi:uncharacterized membrane protein YeaQ/YmgE (transglycosylase-associated protein family)
MTPAFTLAVLVVAVLCGTLTAWVARQKGRTNTEGFVLGFLLGLIGTVIELLLPTKDRSEKGNSANA